MENRELFAAITTVPPVIVRLDGRAFHRFAKVLNLKKPFDNRFSDAMADVCRDLVAKSGLSPAFAYTFSDEISLYLEKLPFSGRVEKIDSVAASFAASALTLALKSEEPVAFDARVIPVTPDYAVEYLVSRQDEAWRNHINAYCQQALVADGMKMRQAAAKLKGMPSKALHDLMHKRGVNLAKTPAWQRRGILVYRKEKIVTGYNPVKNEKVTARRSAVVIDRDLPLFTSHKGREFLKKMVGT
ncbi:MAG: tRNAHis guanylyltransferase [Methanoregula sp. PtaU1.Bin051]|nr:MAG: tRNAHis guanylyltransferase [Methanoregula sp. PtaU1.Bin051]